MDANELMQRLTLEHIKMIIRHLGGVIHYESDKELRLNTICHNGDSVDKLYYYKDFKIFKCYTNCGAMNVITLVRNIKGYNVYEAINFICNIAGISNIKHGFHDERIETINDWDFINSYKRSKKKKEEIIEKFYDENILNVFQNIYTSDWQDDGISIEAMKLFEIKYSTLKQSIIIPHRNITGQLLGVRQRNLLENSIDEFGKYCPFYIHGTTYKHPLGNNLYGIYQNQKCIRRVKKVMLVESEKGTLQAASMFGVNNNFTLALCGNHLTTAQRDLLLSLGVEEVIIAVDKQFKEKDSEEYYQWIKHIQEFIIKPLLPYVRVYVLWDTESLLEYKGSPTDYGKDTLLKLMKSKIYIAA